MQTSHPLHWFVLQIRIQSFVGFVTIFSGCFKNWFWGKFARSWNNRSLEPCFVTTNSSSNTPGNTLDLVHFTLRDLSWMTSRKGLSKNYIMQLVEGENLCFHLLQVVSKVEIWRACLYFGKYCTMMPNLIGNAETPIVMDMFKQHENLLCICFSTQKSDIGTVVELGNIFGMAAMPFLCRNPFFSPKYYTIEM